MRTQARRPKKWTARVIKVHVYTSADQLKKWVQNVDFHTDCLKKSISDDETSKCLCQLSDVKGEDVLSTSQTSYDGFEKTLTSSLRDKNRKNPPKSV